MIPENWKEDLYQKYPVLFEHVQTDFDCGPGWYFILTSLADEISFLDDRSKSIEPGYEHTIAIQVKEKYGELRFYTSSTTDEIHAMIELATKISMHTCEECGNLGSLHKKSDWIYTRCNHCMENVK